MSAAWHGVYPAVTTQFHADGGLDLPATLAHIDRLLGAGMHGLIMLGTVGENCSLEYAEKLEILRATVDRAGGRVPVLSGVAEYTTRLACRFANDAEKIGVDGLMVLPAMVYKSDPRETIAHFRTVARSTGIDLMVYNNPVSYQVDVTPEMFAELARRAEAGGDQGIVRERAPDHRPEECLWRPLHALLRRRRPGAREHSAGRNRLDLGPGQCLPGRERPLLGPGDVRALGGSAGDLSLVYAAVASRHPRQAGAVHQAGAAGMRFRLGSRARPAAAARRAESARRSWRSSAKASRRRPK